MTVCADIWSDHWREHSYLGVTCHWVDNDCVLQKRILAFRCFDEQHTAHNIFSKLQSIFDEYKITQKNFSIDFDNASNNTAAIPALIDLCTPYFGGRFFHQRCVCHVLNLCVQAGLPPKRFPRDVPTRWNSTFNLLSSTIQYKDVLCSFFFTE